MNSTGVDTPLSHPFPLRRVATLIPNSLRYRPIGLVRLRLAAQVDRSSGADFSWCWPSRPAAPACCGVAHSSLALIAASWIRAAANAATMALLTAGAGCITSVLAAR